ADFVATGGCFTAGLGSTPAAPGAGRAAPPAPRRRRAPAPAPPPGPGGGGCLGTHPALCRRRRPPPPPAPRRPPAAPQTDPPRRDDDNQNQCLDGRAASHARPALMLGLTSHDAPAAGVAIPLRQDCLGGMVSFWPSLSLSGSSPMASLLAS